MFHKFFFKSYVFIDRVRFCRNVCCNEVCVFARSPFISILTKLLRYRSGDLCNARVKVEIKQVERKLVENYWHSILRQLKGHQAYCLFSQSISKHFHTWQKLEQKQPIAGRRKFKNHLFNDFLRAGLPACLPATPAKSKLFPADKSPKQFPGKINSFRTITKEGQRKSASQPAEAICKRRAPLTFFISSTSLALKIYKATFKKVHLLF